MVFLTLECVAPVSLPFLSFITHIEIVSLRHRCPFMCCTRIRKRRFLLSCFYSSGSTEVATEEAIDERFLLFLLVFWVTRAQDHALSVPQLLILTIIPSWNHTNWPVHLKLTFPNFIIKTRCQNGRKIHTGS